MTKLQGWSVIPSKVMIINNMPNMHNKLELFKTIAKIHYYEDILWSSLQNNCFSVRTEQEYSFLHVTGSVKLLDLISPWYSVASFGTQPCKPAVISKSRTGPVYCVIVSTLVRPAVPVRGKPITQSTAFPIGCNQLYLTKPLDHISFT